jgi:hypothetical protein
VWAMPPPGTHAHMFRLSGLAASRVMHASIGGGGRSRWRQARWSIGVSYIGQCGAALHHHHQCALSQEHLLLGSGARATVTRSQQFTQLYIPASGLWDVCASISTQLRSTPAHNGRRPERTRLHHEDSLAGRECHQWERRRRRCEDEDPSA